MRHWTNAFGRTALLASGVIIASIEPASAWGALGHRLVSHVAAEKLPGSLPPFIRSAAAVAEIGALGPEADRLKGSGESWDADEDHAHFIDIGDDGMVAGVVSIDALPPTREAYDTLLRSEGTDQYRVGYLPTKFWTATNRSLRTSPIGASTVSANGARRQEPTRSSIMRIGCCVKR